MKEFTSRNALVKALHEASGDYTLFDKDIGEEAADTIDMMGSKHDALIVAAKMAICALKTEARTTWSKATEGAILEAIEALYNAGVERSAQ